MLATPGLGRAEEEHPASKFGELVNQLDHEDFHTRRAAADQLVAAGTSPSENVAAQVSKALRAGLRHPSIEVRIAAAETLRRIELIRHDAQTDRLLNPRCDAAMIQLAGWHRFSSLAGDDMAARRIFAILSERYDRELRALEIEPSGAGWRGPAAGLDPYRLPAEDVVGWSMLLFVDREKSIHRTSNLSSRIGTALSNAPMGLDIASSRDAEVLRRLIDHWVLVQDRSCAARQRLLIAMRYQCRVSAALVCDEIFVDPSASPATQVTALLCGLALNRDDIELQARLRLGDDRTAHVWQLIASRKTKIRTQIGDVALAVLLHHHGLDPRQLGFADLQADPMMVFRDHSLGFPDELSRRDAFEAAGKRLATIQAP